MGGVALMSAVTLVTKIGDFSRFTSPRQLMAWLGLVPKEHSSGRKVASGNITEVGNTRARRMLVEGEWTYRLPARMGEDITRRNEGFIDAGVKLVLPQFDIGGEFGAAQMSEE